ncbi:DsbA family oxidoreductase [Saccharopolyspora rosea]|uniref:DsbA family oxidoreductase n=1 Tax=Saccharopolyspora rosea TaxID=524884 RepID=A0ABW3FMQ7_9PSEU|nr:DsbA family oxidoreductase [Saccharopolyspora rosea]
MLTVEIWSDVACPWCYLGRADWHAALARFPHADQVRTRWRSFELRPGLPAGQGRKLGEIMVTDWGLDAARVDAVFARIRALGEAAGLRLRPEEVRPTSTFDAHRLLHLAEDAGVTEDVAERLFAAYHRDALDLSDTAVLREIAVRSGIDPDRAHAVLTGDDYADRVRADVEQARQVGVTAVPSFRFGAREVVSGATGTEQLLSLLDEHWTKSVRPA